MLYSFLESVKYVGHLIPISFLRIFLGYYYLEMALQKVQSEFLYRPVIAELIGEWLPNSRAPHWYKVLFGTYLLPHWQGLAFAIVGLEMAIGLSYLIGYVVRPVALLGVLLCLNQLYINGPNFEAHNKLLLAVHFMFAWLGAGRCLGVDYYFYKRQRGLWW